MAQESLGIVGYDSFHFVVENLDRSKGFYAEKLDFKEVARGGEDLVARSGQQSIVYGAGDVRVCVSTPLAQHSKAARYLKRHPAGVMSLSFRVQDIGRAWDTLEKRGATMLSDISEDKDGSGSYKQFEIATPLGDVAFRYVERSGDYGKFAPMFDTVDATSSSR